MIGFIFILLSTVIETVYEIQKANEKNVSQDSSCFVFELLRNSNLTSPSHENAIRHDNLLKNWIDVLSK